MATTAATNNNEAVGNGKVRRSQKEISRQLRKTKLCTYYLKGACPFADECAFAHTFAELQAQPNLRKTRICKFWAKGTCVDQQCNFAHGAEELNPTEHAHQALTGRQQRQGSNNAGNANNSSTWSTTPLRPNNANKPSMETTKPTMAQYKPSAVLPAPPPTILDRSTKVLSRNAQVPDIPAMTPASLLNEDPSDVLKGQHLLMHAKLLRSDLMQSSWNVVAASEALAAPRQGMAHGRAIEPNEALLGVQLLAQTLRELTTRCNSLSQQLVMASVGPDQKPAVAFPPPGLEPAPHQ